MAEPMESLPGLNAQTRTSAGLARSHGNHRDMFSAHDKIVTQPVWHGTHTGPYGAIKAIGMLADARYLAVRLRGRQGDEWSDYTGLVPASKAARISFAEACAA